MVVVGGAIDSLLSSLTDKIRSSEGIKGIPPSTDSFQRGNAWERRSHFDSGNGVPRNAIVSDSLPYTFNCVWPNSQFAMLSIISVYKL